MNYEKTIKRMIEQNEYIYMDTCCFMKYKQFYRFIETANKYLKNNNAHKMKKPQQNIL